MGAKPLVVSQRQVAAVMKGAAQAGVHVEVRIEKDVVRFVPCELEPPPVKSTSVDKGKKPYF